MKHLLWLILIGSCFAQDIQRPSVDADGFLGCSIGHGTTLMPYSHDAAGLATSSAIGGSGTIQCDQYTCTSSTQSTGRLFKSWPSAPSTYTALTLNINSSSVGWHNTSGPGNAVIYYSLDGGVTWTTLRDDSAGTGWAQTTNTITLSASQDLTKIQVSVCSTGDGTGTVPHPSVPTVGADNLTIWDIWTAGSTSGQGAGNGSSAGKRHNAVIIN